MYIRTYHDGYHLTPGEELFNVKEDPHEIHDLAAEKPELCWRAAWYLEHWVADNMLSNIYNYHEDPLWNVIAEGGPLPLPRLPERLLQAPGRYWPRPIVPKSCAAATRANWTSKSHPAGLARNKEIVWQSNHTSLFLTRMKCAAMRWLIWATRHLSPKSGRFCCQRGGILWAGILPESRLRAQPVQLFYPGLYPHVRGHRTMSHLLRPGETSMLKELKEAGYYVWMNDRNDLTAGQIPGWTESHATEIYYSGQKKQGPGNVNPDQRGEPGNKYYYSHYEGQLKCNAEGKNYNGDDEVVDAAIERIHNRPADQPLCMFLGLVYPHTPYRVEEPYFSTIDRAKLPKRVHADDCTGKPLMEAEIRKYAGMQDFTDADWDELRAVYLGMCMKIDVQFGKLVEALKEEGIYDDCAIFFLSDHGDFTGDFDLPEKAQNCFEDCLTRVPLLIKPPKNIPLDPGISNSMVELVDFYATAMDLAGVQPTHTHFGHSLRPVLADRSAKVRDYVFCEGGRQPGRDPLR